MKKTVSILLPTILLIMFMTTASFAEVSDYATLKWKSIERKDIHNDPIKLDITLTGVVGQQIDDCTCYTPNISVLYYPEAFGISYKQESDSYTMYTGTEGEDKSFTRDELKKYLSKNFTAETLNFNVVAVVDDGTMTVKLLEGMGSSPYLRIYTIIDGKATGETIIAVPTTVPNRAADLDSIYEFKNAEGQESLDRIYEFKNAEGQESLDFIYEFKNLVDIGIWVVSEDEASELLKQLESELNLVNTADEWAKSELLSAIKEGLATERMTKENYKDNATREEFCEIVMKMYDGLGGQVVIIDDNPFTDTTDTQTLRANKAGIANGSDGKFNPDGKLTRQELCTMIVRALESAGVELDKTKDFQNEYSDIDKIDDWAVESMKILNGYDIYKGNGTNLIPTETVNKQTAVVLLYRTFQMFK